jgi:sister-chromatid-cohesion protein PDS5
MCCAAQRCGCGLVRCHRPALLHLVLLFFFFSRSQPVWRQSVLALLSETSQDFEAKKLETLRVNLLDAKLLKDNSVSLLCARIVAEIMRVCAPDAPYTDDEAKTVVFPLLLQHLQALRKPSGAEFGHVCELLQSLAVCKCFVMLAYTDMALLLKLVDQFFSTVQTEHFETRVAETMLQIMLDVITELDEVPPELLESIFNRLQSHAKTEAPEAYQLAKHLLVRLAKSMEVPLSAYLSQLLEAGGQRAADLQDRDELNKTEVEKARKELQADLFDVLHEVLLVVPDLLLHALPSLERDVTSDVTWWRKLVVEALCRMYAEPTAQLHQDNLGTLAVLLDRFKDKEPSIRAAMVHFAGQMAVAHPEASKTDALRLLGERAQDPDESVRLRVCQTLASLAQRAPTRVDRSLMATLSKRCIDNKFKVAEAATRGLAQAYHDFEARGSPAEQAAAFGWIPAELLKMWSTVSALVEQALDEVIFGDVVSDVQPRAHRLIKLLHSVADEPEALRALSELLRAKAGAQKAFGTLLRLAPRKKNLDASDQQSFDEAVRVLARAVPKAGSNDDGTERVQSVFGQMNVSSIGKACAVVIDAGAAYKDIRKAEEHLNTSFKKLPKPISAYAALVRRVSFGLFTRDIVSELFTSLEEYRAEDDPESQRSLLDFLKVLSSVFPGLFVGALAALAEYARKQEGEPAERLQALTILANCGSVVAGAEGAATAKALKKPLLKAATTGEPRAAKQAARAILSAYSGKDKASLVSDVVRHYAPLPSAGDKDAELQSALAVFTTIVAGARDLFEDAVDVVESVLEQVVQAPFESEGGKEVSERCAAVVCGIRFVSMYVVRCSDKSERQRTGQKVLAALASFFGRLAISKTDAAALRLAAGKAVIRMSLERDLDHLISPSLFEATAWLVASPEEKPAAKEALLGKLVKEAKSLPIRFVCVPVLACHDAAPSVRTEGARVLAHVIDYKRAWMAAALRKCEGNADQERMIRALSLPEYCLPHMVHLLSHWNGFDANNVSATLRLLKTFVDALLRKTDHFTYLTSYFSEIKRHCDATVDQDRTAEIVTICDLAIKYLDEQSKARSWQEHQQPVACVIPRSLFRPKESGEETRSSLLPASFELPSTRGGGRASILKTPEAKKRRVSAAKEAENKDDDNEKATSPAKKPVAAAATAVAKKATPAKKKATPAKKKATPKKRQKDEEEEEESSSVEVEYEASPVKKQKTPAMKATPKREAPAAAVPALPSPKKAKGKAKAAPQKKEAVDEPLITNRITRRK